MAEKKQKLFTDFASTSTQAWEEKIQADLKGKDYERALVWRTKEGFNVQPYYRDEDLQKINHLGTLPGEFPFVRSTKTNNNDWFIRQNVKVGDPKATNKKILSILQKGVTSIGVKIDCRTEITNELLETLLKEICLSAIEINFDVCVNNLNNVETIGRYFFSSESKKEEIIASINLDPLSKLVLKGKFKEDAFETLKSAIEMTESFSNVRVVGVNGRNFANAGASIVQELAFALSMGAEYMTQLTELGVAADDAANNIKFNFGISNNYFFEIAKLRAARLLWAKIADAYELKDKNAAKLISHSENNTFNKTIYDPYVNMLRTQTEAMSAVLGGTNSVTVLPFDEIYEESTKFSERIARNQQILLKEESHFDKIVDPAGGSYYIETLTTSIAEEAWKLFLEVEENGGFLSAFRKGMVQTKVKEMAAQRDKKIAARRENLLGVNQFPNFTETIDAELDKSLFETQNLGKNKDEDVETLKLYRGAQAFEEMRYKTDVYAKNNKRPVAFMLTIGNLTMRKARAQFSCNFFAVAGFEVIDNNGFDTIVTGLQAAREKNADIIVLCSSDDEYMELAPELHSKLNEGEILVIAGNPKGKEELENKGIKNFIHVRSNILEELKAYQEKLNIN